MCAIILGPNMLAGQMRIDLGCAYARVSQQFLDVSQRRSAPQKVRREAVSKRMRRDPAIQARAFGARLQD